MSYSEKQCGNEEERPIRTPTEDEQIQLDINNGTTQVEAFLASQLIFFQNFIIRTSKLLFIDPFFGSKITEDKKMTFFYLSNTLNDYYLSHFFLSSLFIVK